MDRIDYSKYSLKELHQAAESIDRESYPERADALDQHIIEFTSATFENDLVWSKNINKKYTRNMELFNLDIVSSLFVILFLLWRSITIYFFDAEIWDVEEYFWPFYIILLIFSIKRSIKNKSKSHNDYLKLSHGNIEFRALGELHQIDWKTTSKVVLNVSKSLSCYEFYDDKPIKIMPLPVGMEYKHYTIDEDTLLRFIRARTAELNIPFEEKTEIWRML